LALGKRPNQRAAARHLGFGELVIERRVERLLRDRIGDLGRDHDDRHR
jgi:hypothetical protein